MSQKFFISTFGCRTNQADSAGIRQQLLKSCYREVNDPSEADLIVINSCTVTHRSDQQVRQMARHLRRRNSGARIMVTGCYAQREPTALAGLSEVDAVVGNSHKSEIARIAIGLVSRSMAGFESDLAAVYREEFPLLRHFEPDSATVLGGRTRPFLKIQDGCDAKCAYCIIPEVRGPSRSLLPREVLLQIEGLVQQGFQEIVLTGIHLGSYGTRLVPRHSLDRLLEEIVQMPGLGRIRLSSIEPMQLSYRVLELAAEWSDRIAPHFHICLQSGSDRILRRMRRPYSVERFAKIVRRIHQLLPDAAIGTDVIVGFPGEDQEDHERTVAMIEDLPFSYLHVFPYSDRAGTEAAGLPHKVEPTAKRERGRQLRELSDRKSQTFRESFLHRRLSVLTMPESQGGMRRGLSANYIPVKLPSRVPSNQIVEGVVVGMDQDALTLELG